MTNVTYLEQQKNLKEIFLKDNKNEDPEYIYNKAVENTEYIFKERLRNKLSVIINFINIVEKIYVDDNCQDSLILFLKDHQLWNTANKTINEILTITET